MDHVGVCRGWLLAGIATATRGWFLVAVMRSASLFLPIMAAGRARGFAPGHCDPRRPHPGNAVHGSGAGGLYRPVALVTPKATNNPWRRAGTGPLSTCLLVSSSPSSSPPPSFCPPSNWPATPPAQSWNYTQAAGYSLSPAQCIGWLIPGFFGRGPQFHWGAWPRVEVGYIGVMTLILAGLAIALRRDRRTWVWAGLAGISFVLALGIYAIPHGWLTLLPGFGQLRAPARFVLLTDFALAALAAIGLDAVVAPAGRAGAGCLRKGLAAGGLCDGAVLAVGVPLAYLAVVLTQDRDPAVVLRTSVTLIAVVTFAGLLLASFLWLTARRGNWAKPTILGWLAVGLIFLDLASLGAYQDLGDKDPSLSFQQPAIAGFLAAQQTGPFRIDTRTGIEGQWQPDTALLYGFEDVGGVANPLALADATRYWEGSDRAPAACTTCSTSGT